MPRAGYAGSQVSAIRGDALLELYRIIKSTNTGGNCEISQGLEYNPGMFAVLRREAD
jgi:hypothetical protein